MHRSGFTLYAAALAGAAGFWLLPLSGLTAAPGQPGAVPPHFEAAVAAGPGAELRSYDDLRADRLRQYAAAAEYVRQLESPVESPVVAAAVESAGWPGTPAGAMLGGAGVLAAVSGSDRRELAQPGAVDVWLLARGRAADRLAGRAPAFAALAGFSAGARAGAQSLLAVAYHTLRAGYAGAEEADRLNPLSDSPGPAALPLSSPASLASASPVRVPAFALRSFALIFDSMTLAPGVALFKGFTV